MLALKNEKAIGEIFNVGTGKSTSINELAEMLIKLMNGSKNNAKLIYAGAKPGDIRHSRADTTKADKILDFNPEHNLQEELPKMVKWYKKMEDIYP